MRELDIKPESIKLFNENFWSKLLDTGLVSHVLALIPKSQATYVKINK